MKLSVPWASTSCYSDTILILSDSNIPFWETEPSRAENEKDTQPWLSRKAFIRSQYNSNPWIQGQEAGSEPRCCCTWRDSGHSLIRKLDLQAQTAVPETRADSLIISASPWRSQTLRCWQRHLVVTCQPMEPKDTSKIPAERVQKSQFCFAFDSLSHLLTLI